MDEILSYIDKTGARFITSEFSWKSFYWKKNHLGFKEKVVYENNIFMDKTPTHFYFYSGFIPRIKEVCVQKGLECEVIEQNPQYFPSKSPFLPSIPSNQNKRQ